MIPPPDSNRLRLRRGLLLGLVLSGALLAWLAHDLAPPGVLSVAFLDVGQGDSILITSPTGRRVLIDGGPGRQTLRSLSSALPFWSRRLDLLMESHPDLDHIGGFPDVLARFSVRGYLAPAVPAPALRANQPFQEVLRRGEVSGVPFLLAQTGTTIKLGGGAEIDILLAPSLTTPLPGNRASLIARLRYGRTAFLFTGDTLAEIENYLARTMPEKLRADVYKVAHHGSRLSNDPTFIQLAHPTYAVISSGVDNRYGHPHQETLAMLAAASSTVLRTDERGTVTIKSDGKKVWEK